LKWSRPIRLPVPEVFAGGAAFLSSATGALTETLGAGTTADAGDCVRICGDCGA